MKQAAALDILKTGRNVFLTGEPGAGKTHTLNTYIAWTREKGIPVAITASTGIAATHLGGQTIHAWSGIGARDTLSEWDLDAILQNEQKVKRMQHAAVLIIDEISMLAPNTLDSIDLVCRQARQVEKPFGGLQVILSGDLFQLPPVSSGDVLVAGSQAWAGSDIRVCYLGEQHRSSDEALTRILGDIRSGTVSSDTYRLLTSRVGKKLSGDVTPTVLFTHNADVDMRNHEHLEKLGKPVKKYLMSTHGSKGGIASLVRGILAPEELHLSEGAQVMFVKNNFDAGYVNGTRGIVVGFEGGTPVVETRDGQRIVAEKAEWSFEEDGKVRATVTQVPLRLAWAITIHKSQGMTLDAVEIDLSKAFTPGQGYVALSRARTLESLTLKGFNETALTVHPHARELDGDMRRASAHWARVIGGFSREKIEKMHLDFVAARGGRRTKSEVEEPTHLQTLALIKAGEDISGAARSRALTEGTVLKHLELCHQAGLLEPEDVAHLSYLITDLEEILAAFKKKGPDKLTPVFKMLNGKHTFEEIRLARLFMPHR